MRGRKTILAIAIVFLCLFVGTNVNAAERRDVRVAFFPMEGYHSIGADGSYEGMDVEYLNALSNYAGWNIEYVSCDSWEDALDKLENKEVELVGSAQYSEARAEIFDYADLSSGYTFGVIATNPDSGIAYEDFQAMRDITFGMVENYVREKEFYEYLSHNGIDVPEVVKFASTAELHDALDAGEVDAFVHTFTEVKAGQRLIGRFAPRPFYYITYKGNEDLVRELNQAIVDLKMNQPELETELMNQFFYDKFDQEVILTTEEKAYLAEKETLVVGYLDHYYPFSYVKDGEFKGLTREILESGLGITELQLEYRLFENRQDARAALQSGEIDIFACSVEREVVLREEKLKAICDYAQVPLVLLMEKNKDTDDIQRLAMVSFLAEKAQDLPLTEGLEITTLNDQQQCIDALMAEDVDAVLCNGYYAEYLLRTDFKYGDLQIKSVLGRDYSISIAIRNDQDMLSNILEKLVPEIDSKMINEYMLRENTYPLVSVIEFIRSHSLTIIAIVMLVMGLVIFVIAHMLADSKKIQKLMYKDTKMDIWNLNYFTYWGETKILSEKKHKYAIAYLNLTKFRRYNIIYGWNAGERLLETFVSVLRTQVQDDIEICARNRGDRFVLLLAYETEEKFFARIKQIKDLVEKEIFRATGDSMQLQVGIYFIPENEIDLKLGVDYANQALEFVDSNVGSNIKIYDDSIRGLLKDRHDKEKLLESIDIRRHFVAYYQPKVDIRNGNIVGAEALVRFKDPNDGGKIKAPYYFVPYYEQTGRITELDFFVFESVCQLLRRRIDAGQVVVPISCNFSRMHFTKSGFADRFEEVINKYNLSKELIEVEVTETLIMEEIDHDVVKESFEEIKQRGIHLSIDDFGSGYSSLGIFEQIPASVVKMDRSFFLNKNNPDRQVKIMRGIVTLSEELDAQVVCEGVETKRDVHLMEEIGAFVAQGYYYSRPIPEKEFEEKLDIGHM